MFKLALAALLIGAASAANSPPALTLCHVTVTSVPAPGLASPDIGIPFRNLNITATTNCLPARIALGNYGGLGGTTGAPITLGPGQRITLGPLPQYRTLLWLAQSGLPYVVPIQRGTP